MSQLVGREVCGLLFDRGIEEELKQRHLQVADGCLASLGLDVGPVRITEIPLEAQSKILRVLIDQKFKRINSNHDIKVNVRIICTSSKNINNETQLGNFREDLFNRLNVFQISIEPLCNRVSDIALLIDSTLRGSKYTPASRSTSGIGP